MLSRILISLLFVLFCFACQSDGSGGWSERSLLQYNIPVSIMAPDSAKVKTSNMSGVMQDVTITDSVENYAIQILASQAYTQDLARIKGDQIELVRDNPYFMRIVTEETDGFIYENRIDSTSTFGFRYVIFKGDTEIIVQNAMGRIFTEEEVTDMYKAVKQE